MRILIAEDNPVSRLLLKKTVENTGHEVFEAENGIQALSLFHELRPDMIISDWMMPEMDGLELCRQVRSAGKQIYTYLMLLTAKDTMSDLVEGFKAGVDDYIKKPFSPDELRSRIQTGERIINLETRHADLQEELLRKNKTLDQAVLHLKTTQAQAIQSEKMASIGQLAAGIAHEINNPIGFIISNLGTLLDYLKTFDTLLEEYRTLGEIITRSDPLKLPQKVIRQLACILDYEKKLDFNYVRNDITDLLNDCTNGTERVRKIVASLKTFAHPGNQNRTLVDINEGVRSTLDIMSSEIRHKADIVQEFGEIPLVEGYPQELNQVFMNILINAVQAIETTGDIRIVTRKEDDHAVISISDTGCGINEVHLSKIFDPFFTTKDIGKGTGLGLNIAYNIIQKHQGAIHVESTPGKGSTFTITLPGK